MSWAGFMEDAECGDHGVHVYHDVAELGSVVARYLEAGFRRGDPAIVVATPDHRTVFGHELEACGRDVARLERDGLLSYRDADRALQALMEGELPSPERFAEAIGGLVDEVGARFPGRTTRVYGEMVDLLWSRGLRDGAVALEELWNELQRTRRFSLLCAYRLDIFDAGLETDALPEVFRAHTHARPAPGASRLAAVR